MKVWSAFVCVLPLISCLFAVSLFLPLTHAHQVHTEAASTFGQWALPYNVPTNIRGWNGVKFTTCVLFPSFLSPYSGSSVNLESQNSADHTVGVALASQSSGSWKLKTSVRSIGVKRGFSSVALTGLTIARNDALVVCFSNGYTYRNSDVSGRSYTTFTRPSNFGSGSSIPTQTTRAGSVAVALIFTVATNQIAPVFTPVSDIIVEASSGSGNAVSFSTPVATDAVDGNVAVTCNTASGSTFSIGIKAIQCTASDSSSNSASISFTVAVVDTTPPTISPQSSMSVEAQSSAGAIVTYTLPTATDIAPLNPTVTCSPASGSIFKVGTNIVTCTSTDAANNRATLPFVVLVVDTVPPQWVEGTLPAGKTVAAGVNGAFGDYVIPSAVDSVDTSVEVRCQPGPSVSLVLGSNIITCTARDNFYNQPTPYTFQINVTDSIPPTIDSHDDKLVDASFNHRVNGGTRVKYQEPRVHDNMQDDFDATCSPSSDSLFQIGNTRVNCEASDDSGNAATPTSFSVIVTDNTAPIINQDNVNAVATGGALFALVDFTPTVTDNVDESNQISILCQPSSGSSFNIGTTTVFCHANDTAGNTGEKSFIVNVATSYPPNITVSSIPATEATSRYGTIVNFASYISLSDDQTSEADLLASLVCTPASGSAFELGTTDVTCSVSDEASTSTAEFEIRVVDTTVPVISQPSDVVVEAEDANGSEHAYERPTVSDNVDNGKQARCSPDDELSIGAHNITCTFTDSSGNQAEPVTFTVTVQDTTPPKFKYASNRVVEAQSPDGAYVLIAVVAYDSVVGLVPATCDAVSGTYAIGIHTVSCSATDGTNTASVSFTITVQDTKFPYFGTLSDVIVVSTTDLVVTWPDIYAREVTAINGQLLATCAPLSGSTFSVGTTQVTCSATDSSGNTASSSFNVIVSGPPCTLVRYDGLTLGNCPSSLVLPSGSSCTFGLSTNIQLTDGNGYTGSVSVSCSNGVLTPSVAPILYRSQCTLPTKYPDAVDLTQTTQLNSCLTKINLSIGGTCVVTAKRDYSCSTCTYTCTSNTPLSGSGLIAPTFTKKRTRSTPRIIQNIQNSNNIN